MALPGAAPHAAAVAGTSDHDSVVGRLAIGYLGRDRINIAGAGSTADGADGIATPIIGIRYWLSDMLGIDAGLGFGIGSSSVDDGMTDTDGPSTKVFLLHGGVPLSLASAGHFSFQVVPELNVAFASRSQTIPGMGGADDVDVSAGGFHLDVGARAGAEIHFGFIDVPQLSLQGGVGIRLNMDSVSTDNGTVETSASRFTFNTTVGDNPWNIFTSNVAALYYF
jgi:hypothetical protein